MLLDSYSKATTMLSYYAPIFPELFIVLASFVLLMWGVYHRRQTGFVISVVSILVLLGSALLIARHPPVSQELFNGAFVDDRFARFMKILTLAGSAFTLILSFDYMRRERILRFEYPILILLSTAGMMLTISANDLISLYLALEFQSLALYVVAAFHRDHLRSTEAGLKYFVLGVLSSGLLLYGSSLVYGYTGATAFARIAESVHLHGASIGFIFGLVFILAGLAFKISAVPFHMWTPDVYEGAPTPVTVYFASAAKMAAMAMVIRVILGAFPNAAEQWQQIVIAISIASMALGAFAAIGQTNIKRLLAYSSIGHVGYALIGVGGCNARRGRGRRHIKRSDLSRDLPRDDSWGFCLRSCHAPGQLHERGDPGSRRHFERAAALRLPVRYASVFAGGDSAACGLLREILRVQRCDTGSPVLARRGWRGFVRHRRLLLSSHREAHVLRREGDQF